MELLRLQPTQGSTRGGDLVQVQGSGFSAHSQVLFDSLPATVIGVAADGRSIDVRTPEHQAGLVNVTVTGQQSQAMKVAAFAFLRPQLTQESDLTRLVRVLIQSLKRQVLQNTGISVSIDYRGMTHDSVHVVEMANLPALVLTGPRMREEQALCQSAVAGMLRRPRNNILPLGVHRRSSIYAHGSLAEHSGAAEHDGCGCVVLASQPLGTLAAPVRRPK